MYCMDFDALFYYMVVWVTSYEVEVRQYLV